MKDSTPARPVNLHSMPALQQVRLSESALLRPLSVDDASRLLEILDTDPNIRKRVTVANRMRSLGDVVREVGEYMNLPDRIRYALLDSGNLVGLVTLSRDPGEYFGETPAPNEYGFGYFLDPSARGRGLIVTAVGALMRVVKDNLSVDKFVAYCSDDNIESIAVLRKLGFNPTEKDTAETEHGWQERRYEQAG